MRLRSFFADLWLFLAPHRGLLVGVLVGLSIDVAFQTFLPLSLKFLIDRAIEPKDAHLLGIALGALVGGVAVAALASLWRDWVYARLGASVMRSIRQRQFEHVQTLSLDFFARTRPGDLMSRFSTDLAAVETVVVGALPNAVSALLSLALLSVALFGLEARLAAVTVVALPLCLIGPRVLLPRAATKGIEARRLDADVLSSVQENVATQPTVKALSLEARAVAQMTQRLDRFTEASRQFNFLSYIAERTPNITILVFHVAILALGAKWAFDGELSVGSLVAYNALLLNVSAAVAQLTSNVPVLLQAASGMHRVREILDEVASVPDPATPKEAKAFAEELELANVGLRIDERTILDGVTLAVRRGWSVALVGASGCGKSSILRLLARFGDPTSGAITFDGTDVKTLAQASLRQRMGIVLQQTDLFDATVRENIRCAKPDASDEQVDRAAKLAECDAFVRELPDGYDTMLGSGGPQLSGGQRQRLAIARALIREPDILLLDEATSALDPATERSVNQTFAAMRGKHTLISVTHRLGEAETYDRIFVLDAGKLVEEGTHAELVALSGAYAKLAKRQSGVQVSDNLEDASLSVTWLGAFPLFEDVNLWLLEEMTREFVTERHAADDAVIVEGTPGDRFYVVARGTLSVRRLDAPAASRLSVFSMAPQRLAGGVEVATLHEGDAFGEAALLSNEPRNASVYTLTDCVLLSLERSRFQRWLDRDPKLRARLEALHPKE